MEKEKFALYVHHYIKLISLYLNKKEASDFVIDKDNLSFFVRLSKYHSLSAFLFKAIEKVKAQFNKEYIHKLEEPYFSNLRKVASFKKEREELYKYLNDNNIDFLPLKGIVIKDYYYDENTREFADHDILFEPSKDDLVKKYFVERGYKIEIYRRSNHDVYLKDPFFNFEMHRALFGETGDNEKIIKYFNDYLSRAQVKENKERVLSKEDFYIYFTAHSYKHYHVSGCGIRTLIDYYFYLKNNELDFDYINKELEKIDLLDFSKQIKNLAIKVFGEEALNEQEEEMLLYIASSGTYGTIEHSVAKGVKEKGKFGYLMNRVFPPYSFYKSAYPWAYKCPILIPFAWLARFFRVIFKSRKRMNSELKTLKEYKEEDNK